MKNSDEKKKGESKKVSAYKKFTVPNLQYYIYLEEEMFNNYLKEPMCAVCLHPDLVFLAEGGIWQASKDKEKPGLPYAHAEQKLRYICGCCNWYLKSCIISYLIYFY